MKALPRLAPRLSAILAAATILIAGLIAGGPASANDGAGDAPAPPLVDVAWLLENAGAEGLVVLDVRNELGGGSEAVYRAGHIPGAVYSDYLKGGWRTEIDGVPAQLPRLETLEALIGELGIANDSHVVVVSAGTDALDVSSAARVYWTFKAVGHDRVSILDGGYRAYTADPANPVETGWVDPVPEIFEADFRPDLVADRAAVAAALAAGRPLVDTRPTEYFLGKTRHTWAKRAGTIPGALPLPEHLLVRDGHIVKGADATALLAGLGLAEAGEGAATEIIYFCNTGHWSALAWFIQSELLGRSGARVYDGSMVDWTADAERGVVLGSLATQ
ncbi:MAG TPA: rhodanese-like domain-containing protein [Kiloniellaceae bacterium]|nr:rhodanese-like domain-containing protein [Kiloniellaceae bacterium]